MDMRLKWVALLLFVTSVSRSSGQISTSVCANPVPGLLQITRGVDVTTLDVTPLDLTGEHGYMHPIIQYTCTEGKKRMIEGTSYDLPDQIWTLTQVPGGSYSSRVEIFKTSNEVRESMSSQVGGGLTLSKFGFSSSRTYKSMQDVLTNSSSYIERVWTFFSARRADLKLPFALKLDSLVQGFVDNHLSPSFTDDPSPYEDFIRYFGTHYFRTAMFGGMVSLVLETNSSYFREKTDHEVSLQAEASFMKILQANGRQTESVATTDAQFESLTTKTVRYYGGNANLLSPQGLEQWQPTVPARPWLFSGQLEPISVLVRDPAKRTSMQAAVTTHILRAHLGELSRLIHARLAWLETLTLTRRDFRQRWVLPLQNLLPRVSSAQAKRLLDAGEVEGLVNEVAAELQRGTPPTSTATGSVSSAGVRRPASSGIRRPAASSDVTGSRSGTGGTRTSYRGSTSYTRRIARR